MAFWGKSFVFNGYPCEAFDLMLYDVGSDAQGAGQFASVVTVIEENLPSKWKPVFYGTKLEGKLQFDIVFGVNEERLDSNNYLDRYEMDAIASWLTGHDRYMWLEIEQEDMDHVRYRCMITGLVMVEYGNIPWAMKATVSCDGPYAYMTPHEYEYELNGTHTIEFYNEGSHNGYYKPVIQYTSSDGGDLEIVNLTDDNRTFKFTGIPAAAVTVNIDNENCVITNSADLNLYPYFNYKFFRLRRGYNILQITGYGTLKIICEFPVNVGG